MNNLDLIEVLEEIEDKIAKCDILGDKRQRFISTLAPIKAQLKTVEIDGKYNEVYSSLVAKGKQLSGLIKINANPKELSDKINYYINYLGAAYGDFTGQSYKVTKFYRLFLLCSILFLVLSPQFLTPIFSIIFIIPIFMAMKGIKQRVRTGFWLGMLIVPASLMTGIMWIRYALFVLKDFNGAVMQIMSTFGLGEQVSIVLTTVFPVLGIVLTILAVILFIYGNKVKSLFI